MEELREKSDSESFDDELEAKMNKNKAMEAERLQEKLKIAKNEILIKELEFEANFKRMENTLKFSRDANTNLMNDYDNL